MTRKDEVLKLIVDYFIKTAEPVGSKTLVEYYHLNISSATIRHEMNVLSQEGYLEQPHTSAGRIPSSKGYSYYVEHLRANANIDEDAKNALTVVLSEKSKSVEEVMNEACRILSNMTNLASVVVGKGVSDERLVSVQVIPISEHAATAVFVTDRGYVENKTFMLDENIKPDEVSKTVKMLNDRLVGTPICDITAKMQAMKPALTDYVVGQEVIYDAIMEAFTKFAVDRLSMVGKDKLYEQPEFRDDAEKLRALLSLLDDPDALKEAVFNSKRSESGVNVHIGSGEDGAGEIAMVSTEVNVNGGVANLALLGPTRMDYEKAVSTLKYFADAIDAYFAGSTIHSEKGEKEWQKRKMTSEEKSSKKNPSKKKNR